MAYYEEVQPGLITLPLLDRDEAKDVLAFIHEHKKWKPARVYGPVNNGKHDPEVRTAEVAALAKGSDYSDLIEARVQTVIRPLLYQRWGKDVMRHSGVQLVKYPAGGFYKVHRDSGQHFDSRFFTIVCYLNADFEGGETYFPDSDYAVSPEPGKAVIFPSDYLHKGNTVTAGEKYIAVIWMLDSPPVKWI